MLSFSEKPFVRRNSTQIAALKETNAPPEYLKNTASAPDSCKFKKGCQIKRCSCFKANLNCTGPQNRYRDWTLQMH